MAKVQHTCTGCVPIDSSILETYIALQNAIASSQSAASTAADAAEAASGAATSANDAATSANNAALSANAAAAAANAAGITQAEASVDANTGVPSVDVSLVNKKLTLAFHNVKGEKGDKGDRGDGAVPIVNDLTTGGTDAALSAEMGKTLNNTKQANLVSGTNIKTVNGESLLGSGNIVAGDPNAVKYTEQTLTDAQKAQARTNIGAGTGTYTKAAAGIPKTDLESGVQASLDLADTAIQARPSGEVDPTITPAEYATQEELSQLDQKVDGFVKVMTSSDYSEVLIDGEEKILESRDNTGKKKVYTDVEFLGNVKGATVQDAEVKGSIDFVESVVDDDNKMVEATKTNGEKVFFAGIETGDSVPIVPSILYGKKWAVLGDSFTNGGGGNTPLTKGKYKGNLAVYPYIIGNRTGVNVIKFFEGGRTLAWPANPGSFVNSVCNPNATYYYQNIPVDVDYITIYLGINDSQHGAGSSVGEIPIGTISDNTTATYYGAWNVMLAWLLQNRPFAHIGILVSNGCETADWVNAQIAIAKKWGVPYLNLNGDERCPAMIRSWNADLSATAKDIIRQKQAVDPATNTHPNQATHYYESTFIENFLKTL